MDYTKQNFTMYVGRSETVDGNLVDAAGNPLDLTGAIVDWVMQYWVTDVTPILHKSTATSGITVTNATGGTIQITIAPNDTKLNNTPLRPGNYYHEVIVTDSSGDKATVLTGSVTLLGSAVSV